MKTIIKEFYRDQIRFEETKYSLHSWDIKDLEQLKDIRNHKIVYNGYNYVWKCRIDNVWQLRSISMYDNYKTPYSYLMYWLSMWSNEYNRRVNNIEKTRLRIESKAWSRVAQTLNNDYLKNKEKVKRIYDLLTDITKKDVSELTGVSYKQVKRILRDV